MKKIFIVALTFLMAVSVFGITEDQFNASLDMIAGKGKDAVVKALGKPDYDLDAAIKFNGREVLSYSIEHSQTPGLFQAAVILKHGVVSIIELNYHGMGSLPVLFDILNGRYGKPRVEQPASDNQVLIWDDIGTEIEVYGKDFTFRFKLGTR